MSIIHYGLPTLFPVRKRERKEGVVGDQWLSQKLNSNTFM